MISGIYEAVVVDPLLTATGVRCYLGAEHIATNDSPPKMVWVPTTDRFTRGHRKSQFNPRDLRRSIGTRRAGVRVRLWAAATPIATATAVQHMAAAEELLRVFLVVIHQQAVGVVTVESMSWIGQDGQELGQMGRAVDVDIAFELPVYEELLERGVQSALVTVGTQTMTADFPPEGTSGNDATGTPGV